MRWPRSSAARGRSWRRSRRRCRDAVAELEARLRCPTTGTTIAEARRLEQPALQPLPLLGEPFDVIAARRVHRDALISFEGRQYSVPFAWIGRDVEVVGTAQHVVIRGDGSELARHPRHTAQRLLLDPTHYEGPSTDRVVAPVPLGRRGQAQVLTDPRLPAPTAVARALETYAALVDGARR